MKIYKKFLVIGVIVLFFGVNVATAKAHEDLQKKYVSAGEVFPPPSWSIEQKDTYSTWFKYVEGTIKNALCTKIGSKGLQDEKLITCTLNCIGLTGVYVKFDKYFYSGSSGETIASVSFSIDNGGSWILLKSWTVSDMLSTEVLNMPLADGKDHVKVRWRFESTSDNDKSDYYWFDNVYIGNNITTLYETTFDESIDDITIDISPGIYPQADFILKFTNDCSQPRYNIIYLVNWTNSFSIPPKYPSGFIEGIVNISDPLSTITVQSGPMTTVGFIVIAKIIITVTADCATLESKNALLIKFGEIKIIVVSLVNN
jgi:hypothetical protein